MTWQQFYMAAILIIGVVSAPFSAKKFDTSAGAATYLLVFWALCLIEWYALATGGFW